jgi:hypothetical protein
MSFNRYNTEDSVISLETVVRGLWSGDSATLSSVATSSTQAAASNFYLDVYNAGDVAFSIEYAHISGSGSAYFNSSVTSSSPTKVVYGQYRNLIYGTEATNFQIGGVDVNQFYVINIARSRYKETLHPGSLTLSLSGSSGIISLTDNSQTLSTSQFIDSNRYFDIVSGSAGIASNSTVYGHMFPDLGIIVLNPVAVSGIGSITGYVEAPSVLANTNGNNNTKLYTSILGATAAGKLFRLQSSETISSRFFFTRIKNSEYNYTSNPSIIDSTGNILHTTLIDNPQTYITTVGLYNDNNELLAVAKLSKPLVKDFTKEALIRIKLDY